jgi:hypothetical protein
LTNNSQTISIFNSSNTTNTTNASILPGWTITNTNFVQIFLLSGIDGSWNTIPLPVGQSQCLAFNFNAAYVSENATISQQVIISSAGTYALSYYALINNTSLYITSNVSGINSRTDTSFNTNIWTNYILNFTISTPGTYNISITPGISSAKIATLLLTGIQLYQTSTTFSSQQTILNSTFSTPSLQQQNSSNVIATNYTDTSSSLLSNWNIISTNTKNILIINGTDGIYNTVAMPSDSITQALAIQMNTTSTTIIYQSIT